MSDYVFGGVASDYLFGGGQEILSDYIFEGGMG
jgi:hypothetical protein